MSGDEYDDDFASGGEDGSKDDDASDGMTSDSTLPHGDMKVVPTVVERRRSRQRAVKDNTLSDSDDDDDDDDDDSESSQKETSKSDKEKKNGLTLGRGIVDMTPPDKLFDRSIKKARRFANKKKADEAIRELVSCTALVRIVEGDGHWKIARAHVKLATAYFDLKGYSAQALYHAELCESMIRTQVLVSDFPEDKPDITVMLVEMYYTMGRALTADNKLSDADVALTKAEKICRDYSKLPTTTEDEIEDWTVKLSLAMGRLAFKQKKYAVAMTYFEKALKFMTDQYGSDGVELIPIYQSLGRVEQGKGELADHSRAIEYYLQAHSIASANHNDDSLEVADTAYALSLAYAAVSDGVTDDSAESYMREALTIYESVHGASNEKVLKVQDELARLLIRTERLEEGIALLQSTMEARQNRYGDISAQIAEALKLIGSSFLSLGDAEKALGSLKKCYQVECSVYGKNNRRSKDTQRTIDLLLANPALAAKEKKSGKPDDSRPKSSLTKKTSDNKS